MVDQGRYLGTLAMRALMAHHKHLLRASMAEVSQLDQRNRQLAELNRLQAEFLANMTTSCARLSTPSSGRQACWRAPPATRTPGRSS